MILSLLLPLQVGKQREVLQVLGGGQKYGGSNKKKRFVLKLNNHRPFRKCIIPAHRIDKAIGENGAHVFGSWFFAHLKFFQDGLYPGWAVVVEFHFQYKIAGVCVANVPFYIQFRHGGVGNAAQVHVEGAAEIVFKAPHLGQKGLSFVDDIDDRLKVFAEYLVKKAPAVVGVLDLRSQVVVGCPFEQLFHDTIRRVGSVFQDGPLVFALYFHKRRGIVVAEVVAAQPHFHAVWDAIHFCVKHIEPRCVKVDAAHRVHAFGLLLRKFIPYQKGQQRRFERRILFYRDKVFEFKTHRLPFKIQHPHEVLALI